MLSNADRQPAFTCMHAESARKNSAGGLDEFVLYKRQQVGHQAILVYLQCVLDIMNAPGARHEFVISGHVEACRAHTRNLKLVCYITNFVVLVFVVSRFDCTTKNFACLVNFILLTTYYLLSDMLN